jgi:hypothetical protein
MGLHKHYADTGEYLGLTYGADGWWAEDRLGFARWHATERAAVAWLTRRWETSKEAA